MSGRVNRAVSGKRVFVGLSGGVDSAVAAALLKDAGAKVTGVFIKGWYPAGMPCTWAEDRRDAMRVAAHLGIHFHTLDASVEYKQGVIDYLLREYKAGRTPNPDVMCNREVKFGAFANYAFAEGADLIATGHYAQARGGELLRGVDNNKDQSYFLWAVPGEVLRRTLFPLGAVRKEEVRTIAERYKLPNATKKDSQGVCFLGNISIEDFLTEEFGAQEGRALTTDGQDIGNHTGALLHTLGERVRLTNAPPGPWYVVSKDIETNTLTVSHTPEVLERADIQVSSSYFRSDPGSGTYIAQYRYHGPQIPGHYANGVFSPSTPVSEPVAAGQSLVLYRDEVCIGGGIIC